MDKMFRDYDKEFVGREFEILVSQEDIDNGIPNRANNCALALACNSGVPADICWLSELPDLDVNNGRVQWDAELDYDITVHDFEDPPYARFYFSLGDDLSKWMDKFDNTPDPSHYECEERYLEDVEATRVFPVKVVAKIEKAEDYTWNPDDESVWMDMFGAKHQPYEKNFVRKYIGTMEVAEGEIVE